jgi:S-adenosylmethionine decarboxylase
MTNTTAKQREPFGWHLELDLAGCDLDTITSKSGLCRWVTDLCQLIDMKAYGEPWVERFGLADEKTAGNTLVQLIETSSITGHFAENDGGAYLDIFSCRWFDPDVVIAFTVEYFGGTLADQRFHERG